MSVESQEKVYALLDSLGIEYQKEFHPPMFTQADSGNRRLQGGAVIFKNLFLRNKNKSRYFLYSLPVVKRADLIALAKFLGESRLSFGDGEALQEKLNIQHGAVSFLNIIDAPDTDVIILIDDSAFECGEIGVHPNDNTATVVLKPQDISKILDACGVEYMYVSNS